MSKDDKENTTTDDKSIDVDKKVETKSVPEKSEEQKRHDEAQYHQRKKDDKVKDLQGQLEELLGTDETSKLKKEILEETASKREVAELKEELAANKTEKNVLKAISKFELDDEDAVFITAKDKEGILKQAEALSKRVGKTKSKTDDEDNSDYFEKDDEVEKAQKKLDNRDKDRESFGKDTGKTRHEKLKSKFEYE